MKGGGAYFLISRSLGVEFGGAIGLVFFLAQAISVAMYVIGFAEALVGSIPAASISMTTVATMTNIAVFVCVLIGAGWTIKLQYFILAVLVAASVSFVVGSGQSFDVGTLRANMMPNFSDGEGLFTMFALFFPAVTGIMAGANMSGDLRELTDEARIVATPQAIVSSDAMHDIQHTSQNAALVLMGFEAPEEGDEREFYERMERWSGDLPRVVFVDSIGEMSLES